MSNCRSNLEKKRCVFGALKGPFSSIWHTKNCECPFPILSHCKRKQVLERHRPKYCQLLCFVDQDQIDMLNVKTGSTKPFLAQKVHSLWLERQFDVYGGRHTSKNCSKISQQYSFKICSGSRCFRGLDVQIASDLKSNRLRFGIAAI